MPKALIIDDEESISKLIAFNMQRAGFTVLTLTNGRQAYEHLLHNSSEYDLVVLDWMLPEMNGLEICKRLRYAHHNVPIILVTARDEEIDRILGLEIGADDYVIKPFSPRELVARARAVLRRADAVSGTSDQPIGLQKLTVRELTMDVERREVFFLTREIQLTQKEFELLHYMMKRPGFALSRDVLLDEVWGYSIAADTRLVDVHISHLRDKIEPAPKNPTYIRTVRGVGYKLDRSAE